MAEQDREFVELEIPYNGQPKRPGSPSPLASPTHSTNSTMGLIQSCCGRCCSQRYQVWWNSQCIQQPKNNELYSVYRFCWFELSQRLYKYSFISLIQLICKLFYFQLCTPCISYRINFASNLFSQLLSHYHMFTKTKIIRCKKNLLAFFYSIMVEANLLVKGSFLNTLCWHFTQIKTMQLFVRFRPLRNVIFTFSLRKEKWRHQFV